MKAITQRGTQTELIVIATIAVGTYPLILITAPSDD